MVSGRVVRNPDAGDPLFLHPMECTGISHAVFDRAHARVWPFARVPAGRRPGEPNRALATRRCGICIPAATSGRHALEPRRRAVGKCGAFPRAFDHLVAWIFSRFDGNRSQRLCVRNDHLVYQYSVAGFQSDAGLSTRRWTDFAALLWFAFGRARSLLIASSIGFVGVAGLILFAIWTRSFWLGIMAAFILLNCWRGLTHARALARIANAPRHDGFACPVCKVAPPRGAFWGCGKCRKPFDAFETQGVCPNCGTQFAATSCPECGNVRPMSEWMAGDSSIPPKL